MLWNPSPQRIEASQMAAFLKAAGWNFPSYREFHRFSVEHPDRFWQEVIRYFQVLTEGTCTPVCEDLGFERYAWFPRLKLNFAENLLRHRDSDRVALHFVGESGQSSKTTYRQLAQRVAQFEYALQSCGVSSGEVVAAYMPNIPETVTAMLGCTALGGVFTSTSCNFGVDGVVDRFEQVRPKILVAAAAYQYKGKTIDLMGHLRQIERRLPCLEKIVVVDFLHQNPDLDRLSKGVLWQDFLRSSGRETLHFERLAFNAPLYILYSSGTTGRPKAIVHSTGGTLLQHLKELGLHSDLSADKSIFYFTTCGWMMWNWLVSGLALGARVVLYEGSPAWPSPEYFFEMIDREEINIFGTSPRFLAALEDNGYRNRSGFPSLHTLLSTGIPLLSGQFDFIYSNIKSDLCVSSICGGSDIIGCFMLGNPTLPVYRGEIQCLGLGMDVACFDSQGNSLSNAQGELVCRQSFPSRPLGFLGDEGGGRFRAAYFERFPGVWHHGDFIHLTESGGVVVYGRSDTTLNPSGVRIGTAEIYGQIEHLDWLEDSVCVGQQSKGDVKVILFVKLGEGEALADEHQREIRQLIRAGTTPRHVPAGIHQVKDIPYTRSDKKMELLVSRIINGLPCDNLEAVANPECLEEYRAWANGV